MVSAPLGAESLAASAPAAATENTAPPIAPPVDAPMPRRDTVLLVAYSIVFMVIPGLAIYVTHVQRSAWMLAGNGRLLLLAVLIGMAMGAVHSLASISAHAGKHDLGAAWRTYYACRPFTGGGIALVTCLILLSGLGGFTVPPASEGGKRELVVLAWAALAGLYSQSALDKLKELFASIFATKGEKAGKPDAARAGKGDEA